MSFFALLAFPAFGVSTALEASAGILIAGTAKTGTWFACSTRNEGVAEKSNVATARNPRNMKIVE